MTTPQEPIVARVPVRALPIPFDDDLVLDFRNRDPSVPKTDPGAYPDYPEGTTGTLTIYADLKIPDAERISTTVPTVGSHCVVLLDQLELAPIRAKAGIQWRFRLRLPFDGLPGGGYDKSVVVGLTVIDDGKAWPQ
ncbi:hypothetical protein [Nocardia brasiliensis]|uniref:hypothetical protein n=1 Tax=Nocardia brasiliensis TaxID=37326 RepID=UPI0024561EE8|nr:hypothetical protein [Nocardia brasiliensis]